MAWISTKVTLNGITFDSETESRLYIDLIKLKKENKIKDFEHEPNHMLQPEFFDINGQKIKAIEHRPDFKLILNDDRIVYLDSKGGSNQLTEGIAKIKRKMFIYQNQKIPYHFVSEIPKYLGNRRVETSSGKDFLAKLKNKYFKEYPSQKIKQGKKDIWWVVSDWDEYFEYEDAYGLGLFYSWVSTKRIKKVKK